MASQALTNLLLLFSLLSPFFFFFFLVSPAAAADKDLIEQTCEFAEYYKESCIGTLRSEPASERAADVPGLVAIMLDKAKAVAKEAQDYISMMLQNCNSADTRLVLTGCHKVFDIASTSIDQTLEALVAKDFYEAEAQGETIEEVSGCDDYFSFHENVEYPSEIYKKTFHLVDLADMITNIITALKNNQIR
ncbi:hypothetical protein ACLOJK_015566 [Asimina triloba]